MIRRAFAMADIVVSNMVQVCRYRNKESGNAFYYYEVWGQYISPRIDKSANSQFCKTLAKLLKVIINLTLA